MQENSIIKQNILLYLENKGVTPYKIYKENGVTRGILTQNNDITEENLLKFVRYAQDISLDWLLKNEGSMLKNEPDSTTISGENTQTDSNNSIILSLIQQNGDLREEVGRLKAELERLKAGTGNALNVATA